MVEADRHLDDLVLQAMEMDAEQRRRLKGEAAGLLRRQERGNFLFPPFTR